MTDPGILIAFFVIYFLVTLWHIYKIDIIYALFYLFLFIYTIFAQIGYVYFPELSMMLNAYYGIGFFYKYYEFVFLSFLSFYVVTLSLHKRIFFKNCITVDYTPSIDKLNIFYVAVVSWQLYLVSFFLYNYSAIGYDTLRDEKFALFTFFFKTYNIVNIVLYSILRSKPGLHKVHTSKFYKFLLVTGLVITVFIGIKSGNRIDLLMLAMPLLFIELATAAKQRMLLKKSLQCCLVFVLILSCLNFIRNKRAGEDAISNMQTAQKIIFNDYYAPSHILFAAMHFDFIDPLEVLKSNVCNALVKMDYPYLQTKLGNLILPDSSSRKTGFAYYIFAEGFMAFGRLGFIYNGLIVFAGITIWRTFSKSNNADFNIFIMSLIVGQVAGIARAQSSYFIKNFYVYFVPAMVMFYFATGLNPFRAWHILRPLPRTDETEMIPAKDF